MEIGDIVKVIATGQLGTLMIAEGFPTRKVYLELHTGADGGYAYYRMPNKYGQVETLTLNCYDIGEVGPWKKNTNQENHGSCSE